MAVSDFLFVLTDPLLRRTGQYYFPNSFLHITPVCSLNIVLLAAATTISVWVTVAFTFDRFVAICCEKLKSRYCTERTAAVVIGIVCVLGCLVCVPWYFIYEPHRYINGVPLGCAVTMHFLTSESWAAFDLIDRMITPFIPFFLILLLNILTVRRILAASGVRRGFRSRSNGENDKDPEMENRKKSILLLFSITASFILSWLTKVVFNIYRRLTDVRYYSYSDPNYIAQAAAFMLQVLNSCTNTCIYILTQRRFRQELWNLARFPLNLAMKVFKS
ncbi:B1 bradykinin receptor-like [Amblyraja radiata]|uniref:B1 bradykinin receptor-like n=1 Tax=Amblyraja radiata TaxID=386614 RepID=UPI001402DBBC|nr:B1 bradykinin receptor-like [Amblyraja radiata]